MTDINVTEKEQNDVIADDIKIRADWQKLTDKQRALIRYFLKTGNKTRAYLAAHYDGVWPSESRVKKKTVIGNCYAEFRKPHIRLVIEQIQEKAVKDSRILFEDISDESVSDLMETQMEIQTMKIDSLWVLKRAALLADFNLNRFITVHDNEAVYDFSTASEDDWYCIQEYTSDHSFMRAGDDLVPVHKVKVKSYDKLRALELVGKHVDVGAFKDKVELSGDESNPIQTITRRIVRPDDGPSD